MAKIHTPIPSLKPNDGNSIPLLAYATGTAWYKASAGDVDRKLVDAIKLVIDLGYHHLDGAEMYNTEPELGLVIKESGVARDKLYVATKVNKNVDNIELALDDSLKKLQLDHVDLYLINSPFFAHGDANKTITGPIDEEKLQATWAAMEKVKASGKTRSIGVSNYLPQHLSAVLKTTKIHPAINQIEFQPHLQHSELLAFQIQHNIAISAYGLLTAANKAKPGPADELLAALAKKYAVSEAEISLRYCMDQDIVAITTSAKEQRLSYYLRSTKFKLTPAEIKHLNEAGDQKHFRGFWGPKFDPNDKSWNYISNCSSTNETIPEAMNIHVLALILGSRLYDFPRGMKRIPAVCTLP